MDLLATQPDPVTPPTPPAATPSTPAPVPTPVSPPPSVTPLAPVLVPAVTPPPTATPPSVVPPTPAPAIPVDTEPAKPVVPMPVPAPKISVDEPANKPATADEVAAAAAALPIPDSLNGDDIANKGILELMGLEGIKNADRDELYVTMLKTIQLRVAGRIADALPDEQFKEWNALPDQKAKEQYLTDHQVDVGKFYLEETLLYKTEMAELAQGAKKAMATAAAPAA